MNRRFNRPLGWQLGLGFTLLAGICAIATGVYLYQVRQHLGSNYTALVADVIRPQLHTVLLRSALEDFHAHPQDSELIERFDNLLWRIPQHIEGVEFGLSKTPLAPAAYEAALNRLERAREHLPELRQALGEIAAGAPPDDLIQQGFAIENDLAQAYSRLSYLLHAEAAKQRIVMERLAIGIALLILVILILVGCLMLVLMRLHHQHKKVLRLSLMDELTGLGNRRYMLNFTDLLFEQSQRSGLPLSMALIDLDHFKRVNDDFGHPAGDQVLKVVADALLGEVRKVDVVARLGGEEFCVLMPETDTQGALDVTERIRQRVASLSHQAFGVPVAVTVSLGLATVVADDATFDQLYSRADQALYQAKLQGRNRVAVDCPHGSCNA
ncbi:GGDEF domain-containing protein [Halomonas sp. CUBES01]|uniref:diguanylate cyclase n=1 Tax=Vreelandella gomseomensis TaxID=370766 RepID=A0ABU1GE31_9GAMM|nr:MULTISPECIES: GGDEF domain-containing protein [Halomonas]MDR5875732.1 GGDEF domain-containing protein [Halomonas gomseomensis]MEC4768731.1 GGDEF domain-containing protein [Halomonas sp. CUBES01]